MVLSDRDIKRCLEEGRISIDPIDNPDVQIQPASVDLRLGNQFKIFRHTQKAYVDPLRDDVEEYTETIVVEDGKPFVLHPGEFVLACTREEVGLGEDIVARVEGRSSLGRLALLVHASLPYEEEIVFKGESGLKLIPIGDIVEKKLRGEVLAFDPGSKKIGFHAITEWINNRRKRIFEVVTSTGRKIGVSESHNLFTVNAQGDIVKVPTRSAKGLMIIASSALPNPGGIKEINLIEVLKGTSNGKDILVHLSPYQGYLYPDGGMRCFSRGNLMVTLEDFPETLEGEAVFVSFKGESCKMPVKLVVTFELAYALGLFVVEGCIGKDGVIYADEDPEIIKVLESYFGGIGASVCSSKDENGLRCLKVTSSLVSRLFSCLGFTKEKDIPDLVWNFSREAKEAFLEGMIHGGVCVRGRGVRYCTKSEKLARKLSLLGAFLGYPSSVTFTGRGNRGEYRVEIKKFHDDLMQYIPVPGKLLKTLRGALGLTQKQVSLALGWKSKTRVSNIENMYYEGVTRRTLQRLAKFYIEKASEQGRSEEIEMAEKLYSLAFSSLVFDKVVEVKDTGRVETTYDLGVVPVENFLSASSVFLSNTAGYIDPGFRGNVTLELSNVGKMPIALYPGMRVCQLSFEFLSSKAERPYGHPARNSKYQGQRGPTSSRIHLDKKVR
jgi:dCTP deaminase